MQHVYRRRLGQQSAVVAARLPVALYALPSLEGVSCHEHRAAHIGHVAHVRAVVHADAHAGTLDAREGVVGDAP